MSWRRGERANGCDDVDAESFLANVWRLGLPAEPSTLARSGDALAPPAVILRLPTAGQPPAPTTTDQTDRHHAVVTATAVPA